MANSDHQPDPALTWRVDTELRMLADAIELVRRGGSARVTLGGLRFGDQLLARGIAMAADAGVRVTALYATDETAGTDIVVERSDEGALDRDMSVSGADTGAP